MKDKIKISIKFYLVLAFVLVLLAIVIAITSRAVLGGIKTASEVDDTLIRVGAPRVNEQSLKKALDFLDTKSAPALDSSL